MEQNLSTLRRRGSPGVHLGVSTRNTNAQRLYRRLGFEELVRVGPAGDGCVYLGLRLVPRGK